MAANVFAYDIVREDMLFAAYQRLQRAASLFALEHASVEPHDLAREVLHQEEARSGFPEDAFKLRGGYFNSQARVIRHDFGIGR